MRPRTGSRLVTLGLIASLLVNVFAGWSTYRQYVREGWLRIDPGSTRQLGQESGPPVRDGRLRVAVLGDSRVCDWMQHFDVPGASVESWGVPGDTSAQALVRLRELLPVARPDVVVIQVGVNDLKFIPLNPDEGDWIVTRVERNVRAICDELAAAGVQAVVMTIIPTGTPPLHRRPFWSDAVDPAVRRINDTIRARAVDGAIIVDCDVLRGDDGRIRDEYASGLLHVNAKGYAVLNQELARALTDVASHSQR